MNGKFMTSWTLVGQ